MASDKIINITSVEVFEKKVVASDKPVLVDFWAPWCGPCKTIGPILEKIAEERKDVNIVKVNVDDQEPLAVQYGIRGIPALLLFKDGELVQTKMGSCNKQQLLAFINDNLK